MQQMTLVKISNLKQLMQILPIVALPEKCDFCQICFMPFLTLQQQPIMQPISCQICKISAHYLCYNIKNQESNFICDGCANSRQFCEYCKNPGLLTQILPGIYAHFICALTNQQLQLRIFNELTFQSSSNKKATYSYNKCSLCQKNNNTMKCQFCQQAVHVYCALKEKQNNNWNQQNTNKFEHWKVSFNQTLKQYLQKKIIQSNRNKFNLSQLNVQKQIKINLICPNHLNRECKFCKIQIITKIYQCIRCGDISHRQCAQDKFIQLELGFICESCIRWVLHGKFELKCQQTLFSNIRLKLNIQDYIYLCKLIVLNKMQKICITDSNIYSYIIQQTKKQIEQNIDQLLVLIWNRYSPTIINTFIGSSLIIQKLMAVYQIKNLDNQKINYKNLLNELIILIKLIISESSSLRYTILLNMLNYYQQEQKVKQNNKKALINLKKFLDFENNVIKTINNIQKIDIYEKIIQEISNNYYADVLDKKFRIIKFPYIKGELTELMKLKAILDTIVNKNLEIHLAYFLKVKKKFRELDMKYQQIIKINFQKVQKMIQNKIISNDHLQVQMKTFKKMKQYMNNQLIQNRFKSSLASIQIIQNNIINKGLHFKDTYDIQNNFFGLKNIKIIPDYLIIEQIYSFLKICRILKQIFQSLFPSQNNRSHVDIIKLLSEPMLSKKVQANDMKLLLTSVYFYCKKNQNRTYLKYYFKDLAKNYCSNIQFSKIQQSQANRIFTLFDFFELGTQLRQLNELLRPFRDWRDKFRSKLFPFNFELMSNKNNLYQLKTFISKALENIRKTRIKSEKIEINLIQLQLILKISKRMFNILESNTPTIYGIIQTYQLSKLARYPNNQLFFRFQQLYKKAIQIHQIILKWKKKMTQTLKLPLDQRIQQQQAEFMLSYFEEKNQKFNVNLQRYFLQCQLTNFRNNKIKIQRALVKGFRQQAKQIFQRLIKLNCFKLSNWKQLQQKIDKIKNNPQEILKNTKKQLKDFRLQV